MKYSLATCDEKQKKIPFALNVRIALNAIFHASLLRYNTFSRSFFRIIISNVDDSTARFRLDKLKKGKNGSNDLIEPIDDTFLEESN